MIGGCGIDNRQQTLSNNHSDSVSKGCFTEGEVLQLLRVARCVPLFALVTSSFIVTSPCYDEDLFHNIDFFLICISS